jgi:hypothetical protein
LSVSTEENPCPSSLLAVGGHFNAIPHRHEDPEKVGHAKSIPRYGDQNETDHPRWCDHNHRSCGRHGRNRSESTSASLAFPRPRSRRTHMKRIFPSKSDSSHYSDSRSDEHPVVDAKRGDELALAVCSAAVPLSPAWCSQARSTVGTDSGLPW